MEDDLEPKQHGVDAMLTDVYQITMAYTYWKSGRQNEESVFDLFFRAHPFKGEFTIFAGLEEALGYVERFGFSEGDIDWLKDQLPSFDQEFWEWLAGVNTKEVKIFAIQEGSIVMPRMPLVRVEGPLAVCQMLETTLLVLINYASLVATNAARHRLAVGPDKILIEWGLRRAQGPNGAMAGSRYAYVGGFDCTTNLKAIQRYGIGTSQTATSSLATFLAFGGSFGHSFVVSYSGFNDLKDSFIIDPTGKKVEFVDRVLKYRHELKKTNTNDGELASFIGYAQAVPIAFLALVDTYDTLNSGVWNFLAVALALIEIGYKPLGIRLDSGDLAYLSTHTRGVFKQVGEKFNTDLSAIKIVASNDLSEGVLYSLKEQGHDIDAFGIGTDLITCRGDPALGCVYKLMQSGGKPRIKISHDPIKVTIPGKKEGYRLYVGNQPVVDLLTAVGTTAPAPRHRILCRHAFDANKRVYVTPSKVVALHSCVWDGTLLCSFPSLAEVREFAQNQLHEFRADHLRRLNPTPYKVSLTSDLYTFMHDLWLSESSVPEIK